MSVASTLKDALALFQAGDLDAAQAACAALLERDPAHFDVLHLRGLIALRRGLAEEAANFLASAIARNAGNASAHLNYAKALNAYVTVQHEAHTLLATLTAQIDAHQDELAPDEIHWGHVEDLKRIVAELRTLTTQED